MSDRDDLRIAWAPAPPEAGDPLALADHAAASAAALGASLLLLPEAHLGGPQPSDGEGPAALAAIARRHRLAILGGYLEAGPGGPFSAALVLDRQGHAIGHTRRSHAAPEGDAIAGRGGWLSVVPLLGRRCGLVLGADLWAPEVARALVLSGADLLVSLQAVPLSPVVVALATARAVESRVPLVLAAADSGLAVDPAGERLDRAPVAVPAPGDLEGLRGWRRPELYRALLEPGPASQAASTRRR